MQLPPAVSAPETDTVFEAALCVNCSRPLRGPFCSACGQKALRPNDFSLGRYLRESSAVLTNTDSRLFRSFRSLLLRPGHLTAEYVRGRHAPYLQPLQLFLLCNLFYFLVQPLTGVNTLTTPLSVHMAQLPYSPFAAELVRRQIAERGTSLAEYRVLFDATISSQAKTLVVLMVPLLAIALHAIFWRRRRYLVEHLVFATHFYAFFLLAVTILSGVVTWSGPTLARAAIDAGINRSFAEWFFDVGTILIVFLPYLYLAIRRAYAPSVIAAAAYSVVTMVTIVAVLQAYRLILFFTTVYSIH